MMAGVRNQSEPAALSPQQPRGRLLHFLNRTLLGYAALIVIAGWSFGVWHIYRERAATLERNERLLTTIAVGVSQHVEAMLNDGVGAARAAVNVLEAAGSFEKWDAAQLGPTLRSMLTGGDYVKALFIVSGQRYVEANRAGGVAVANTPPSWLQALPRTSSDRPWVGAPIPDARSANAVMVPIAVQIVRPGGESVWAGALFGVDSIQSIYEQQQFVDGVIALVSADGMLLARVPPPPASQYQYELGEALTAVLHKAMLDSWQSPLEFVGPLTGVPMIFVGRTVAAYPLAAAVGVPREVAFAPWVSQSRNTLVLLLTATLVVILLTWFLGRSIEALKAREVEYRTLFENAGVSVFLMQDDRFLEANRKTYEMFRLPLDQPFDRLHPWDISPPLQPGGEDSERLAHDRLSEANAKGQLSFRWSHKRMDTGEVFPAEVSLSTLKTRGSNLLLAIVHDLSDLESAKGALEQLNVDLEGRVLERTHDLEQANLQLAMANEELESFAASASHDLRSPLGSISGMAGLLQAELKEGRTDTTERRLNRIQESVKRMAGIIDGLLSLARMTTNEGHYEHVDLSEMAAGVEAELRQQYVDHPVVTVFEGGISLNADPRLIRTVLSNLLGNAWKYTQATPHPKVELERLVRNGVCEYVLRDNGVGFDMRYMDKLFKPFRRLHTAEQFPGIGIGLATVARIVRRYGGQIWAESRPGEETAFHFTMPATDMCTDASAKRAADAA